MFHGLSDTGARSWGLGEGTPRGISGDTSNPAVRRQFLFQCAEKLVGRKIDVLSPAGAVASVRSLLAELFELAAGIAPKGRRPFRGTLAGIEAGLLDLIARHFDMQVSDLLGRRRDQVPVSTISLSLSSAGRQRSTAIGMISRRFGGWRLKADGDVARQMAALRELARTNHERFIWLDFNQALGATDAVRFLQSLREAHEESTILNPIILEQPTSRKDLVGLTDLQKLADSYRAAGLEVIIMADEAVSDVSDWMKLRAVGRVGAVNIKVQKAGGLLPSLDLANRIFKDDPEVQVYVGNMLNYSDFTRWQLIEIAKSVPRLDYFTTSPAASPLDFCNVAVSWSDGAVLSDKPKVDDVDGYVDLAALGKVQTFERVMRMTNEQSVSPARPALATTQFRPAVIASSNQNLGEIPRYWGRNVFSNALFEASALSRRASTVRSSACLFFAETGSQRMSVYAQTPMETGPKNLVYTRSKTLAKFLYERDNIRTPAGRSFSSGQKRAAVDYASSIGFPVVLKPDSGHGGHGVVLGIASEKELAAHLRSYRGESRFLVESQLKGNDHRFLILGGKTVAVWRRIPANVVGANGKTIRELVSEKNAEKSFTFSRLRLDESIGFLNAQGLTPDSVPGDGQQVFLNDKENLTQGGDAMQMLNGVHPSYYAIAERIAAGTPNVTHLAVDMMIENAGQPATDLNWAVLESNSRPDILGGQYPDRGTPLPLSDLILESYAQDRLTLQASLTGPITVEVKLHFQAGHSRFDKVLDAIAAVVPLEIIERRVTGDETATALVTGTASHLAMLSTYMFHPEVEAGHNMCELTQVV